MSAETGFYEFLKCCREKLASCASPLLWSGFHHDGLSGAVGFPERHLHTVRGLLGRGWPFSHAADGSSPSLRPRAAGLHPPLLAWPGFAPLRLVCPERGPRPDGGGGGLVHGRGMRAQLSGEVAKVRAEVGLLLPRAPPTWRTALHPNAGTAHTPARSQFQNTWSAYGKRGDSGTLLRAVRRPLSAPQVTHSQSPALDAAASHSARQLPLAGARAPLTSFQAVRFLSKMAALVLLRLSTPAQEHDDLQG